MKKLMLLLLLAAATMLAAELTLDIPFDQNIVGDSYADSGPYNYESDWMTLTNTGSSAQEYTIEFQTANVPNGWNLGVCNEVTCYMPNFPVPFTLGAGESLLIHITVYVNSADSFEFPIIFDAGDLTEPQVYNFSFATADANNSADEDLLINNTISNYPNPFNPETTFKFSSNQTIQNGKIEIFNVVGQKVTELEVNSDSVVWKADKETSGIYFYRLVSDNFKTDIKKMTLMK